ncbi:MAG TPA: class I fructose-bisphosphate aldolase [Ferrovibrio sp.]|jgi:fructose-bisphosphate aldolase class I|uniref:class I fructose-bisphosphate aldolase n=1 Tax=Ferrovibrio sp. TaxID=1917215 RepID=UPI002B4B6610|nr:class I fructose-bisphosphate aldolase [Ferrovibrio sp.]HLT79016.1 class I fructose-bisphosphate aldolase [Ferrovibrio sp.]
MNLKELNQIAEAMVAPGKGILAADESTGTIEKRLSSINVPNTEENRRDYREMLFTTQDCEKYISGVILYDETLRQKAKDGTPFVEILKKKGIVPGIKVDKGTVDLPGSNGEKITEGLDGLRKRLQEYHQLGARFAKWRAVLSIDEAAGKPSRQALVANAEALARYAALCQAENIVPIVEPEILMDGAHGIDVAFRATERTLHTVFEQLALHNVAFEGMILKPNMVIHGESCKTPASVDECADATVKVLLRTVPAAVPGIAFLSGGQSDEDASAHLGAMNARNPNLPWKLTFSYGRALQALPLKLWGGKAANVANAQKGFLHRARLNSLAASGKYEAKLEQEFKAA